MGVNSLTRDTLVNTVKYNNALAGNDTADVALSSDFLIQEVILNGSATSVTFDVSTLASTYKHLQIRGAYRYVTTSGAEAFTLTFNGDTGSNYSHHRLLGNGSSVSSTAGTSTSFIFAGFITSQFGGIVLDILDAFSTSKNKTTRALMGALGSVNEIHLTSGNWRNLSAVTSITLSSPSSAIQTGSRFSLYGSKG
jgi:hypothetical protein